MKKYKPYLNRVDLVKNQVEREELREQEAKRKRSRSIQEQNKQRWLKYQEQLRSELAARYFHSVMSTGGESFSNKFSVAFDGSNDFVSTGLNLSYTTYPNVSFSCWIKMDKASLNTFTSYSPTGAYVQTFPNSSPIRILTNGTKQAFVSIQGSGGTTVQSTTDLSDGNWHHIVQTARYEATGTVNNVYVDSVKEITDKLFLSYSQITGDFFVGARNSTTQFFVGGIDEVAVFDSELAQSDITAIYGTGVPTSLATYNPLLWYRMGDGDTFPTLIDNGSGGNNGTMTNMDSADIVEDIPG